MNKIKIKRNVPYKFVNFSSTLWFWLILIRFVTNWIIISINLKSKTKIKFINLQKLYVSTKLSSSSSEMLPLVKFFVLIFRGIRHFWFLPKFLPEMLPFGAFRVAKHLVKANVKRFLTPVDETLPIVKHGSIPFQMKRFTLLS